MNYLSQIITDEEISTIKPGLFNILKAPRGIGKTTFMFDDRILAFARAKKHILYLIHNKVARDTISQKHADAAVVYDGASGFDWFSHRQSLWVAEEDENKVHVMCYQTFAALLRKEGTKWLDDIDLIVWDEFDDVRKFFLQEIKNLRRQLPEFSTEKLTALLESGNDKSVVSFIYKIKNLILDGGKIVLLAVSATPELAANLFADYVNYIIKGKIEEVYDAKTTIYIENMAQAFRSRIIEANGQHKFWCYTRYISDILRIEKLARDHGFEVLSLWSKDNNTYKGLWTHDKDEAMRMLRDEGRLPSQYDFVIVNDVIGRAIDVIDTTFQDWVCNSKDYEEVGQFIRARFAPERKYLRAELAQVDFNGVKAIPVSYYEWHSVSELREMVKREPIYSKEGKPYKTWAEARKALKDMVEHRRYGEKKITQYRLV